MSIASDTGEARKWETWIVLSGAVVALSVCFCSPSLGQESRGPCEEEGETLVIYDCQTGLVLWSRRQPGQTPPIMPPSGEQCRLVAGPTQPLQVAGKCL